MRSGSIDAGSSLFTIGSRSRGSEMAGVFLSLDTKLFDEGIGGLMVCGINSAGPQSSATPTGEYVGESFLSDSRFTGGRSPYRRNIIRWFGLLGHPLAGSPDDAGPFERSIVQTNWLTDQSPNVQGRDVHADLVREWANFQFHIERIKPSLLFLMGHPLLSTLNSEQCLPRATELFGQGGPVRWEAGPAKTDKEERGRAALGFQQFEKLAVVAFPHPSWPQPDDHIAYFKPLVSPLIADFKTKRGF